MISKEYKEVYPLMTDREKVLMHDLFMESIEQDEETWVRFNDVERVVALIIKEFHGKNILVLN